MDVGLTPGEILLAVVGAGYALLQFIAKRTVQSADSFTETTKKDIKRLDDEIQGLKIQRLTDTTTMSHAMEKLSLELSQIKKQVQDFSPTLTEAIHKLEQSFRADMTKLIRPPPSRKR